MSNLIIFGGTFDPIHNGHLNTAINVQRHFNFERFIFLPCKIPVLKNNAVATTQQRIDMLTLALQDSKNKDFPFELDTREITRPTPSFTITTLEDYRNELGHTVPITLLMGIDSFAKLPLWHKWGKLLRLANILVINRPGFYLTSPELNELLAAHQAKEADTITHCTKGLIYQFDAGLFDLSSTAVRAAIHQQKDLSKLVPKRVASYINQHHLYQKKIK